MRKFIFYLALILAAILLWQIIKILIYDFNRLTEWGMGYLVGKIILFAIFAGLAFFVKKRKTQSSN